MLEKIYSFGGLDLRSSDINREKNKASDLQNVQLDSNRQIEQRSGYALETTQANVKDMVEYRKDKSLLLFKTSGLTKRLNGVDEDVNFGGGSPVSGWPLGVDSAEYNGVTYFTDINGENELFKFDGITAYQAGIPQTSGIFTGVGGAFFYRIAMYFIDIQGNITWGDYQQFDSRQANETFTLDTLTGFNTNTNSNFYAKHGLSSAVDTIDSGDLTLAVFAGHNYVAGDYIRAINSDNVFVPLLIDSTSATEIIFDATSVGTQTFNYAGSQAVERRSYYVIFRSSNATFGYTVDAYLDMNNVAGTQAVAASATAGNTIPANDIYDMGIVRLLPPKCKYVEIYGGTTLVLGGLSSEKNSNPVVTNTTPETESTIFWSSVFSEFGTSIENFLPFYTEIIGTSYEGPITGLFGGADSLTILKENQLYYMNGVLQELQYRPRSALSVRIGCVSHRSIIEAEGGCLFMSAKGVYLARYGQQPLEISDLIEPLFTNDTTGLDLTLARVAIDFVNERVHWFIPATLSTDNVVLTFNYYYREWFKHKGIDASQGLVLVNDTELYHCDGTSVFKRDDSLNDVNTPIDAFYASHWHHLGEPSIRKKFTNFILASLSNLVWDCNVKTQLDWVETDRTDVTIPMSDTLLLDDKRLNITQSKACRFIIGNAKKSQGLLLTGYEFIYEFTQETPKGES